MSKKKALAAAQMIMSAPKQHYGDGSRKVAASVLSQAKDPEKKTTKKIATIASKILNDLRFSEEAQTCAASALSQA